MNKKYYSPREDTSLFLEAIEEKNFENKKILEMGIGSGIIAKKCLEENPKKVVAVDKNKHAVRKSRKELSDFNNKKIIKSDLFANLNQEKFDYILFNPPYLPTEKEPLNEEERAWKGGKGGIEVLKRFLSESKDYLEEHGKIIILVSDLGDINSLKNYLEKMGFEYKLLAKEKLFFEKLSVLELKNN
ncbi:methyltransferase [archaeon SCG-AAA382B04]|nr:methyltransferase [archaeon SCG-AAA382B04]